MTATMEANQPRRSNSRSRRSHPSFSDLRLAPLSTQFALEQQQARFQHSSSNTPHLASPTSPNESTYLAHHSSYLTGRSAPTTPGILSRSSSRRHLHGLGLSRKLSVHNDASEYNAASLQTNSSESRGGSNSIYYAPVPITSVGGIRDAVSDGRRDTIPKAKSDAALLAQARLNRAQKQQLAMQLQHGGRHHRRLGTGARTPTGGMATLSPVVAVVQKNAGEDWLTHAGATTSSLLRESKGQSWLLSREASTGLGAGDSDAEEGEDDEVYRTVPSSANRSAVFADDEYSPETPRVGSRWGSRFGSRVGSARNSRRGSSVMLARTPGIEGVMTEFAANNREGGYFDQPAMPVQPDFVDLEEDERDEVEVARLAQERSFGLGGLVDRLVGFSLFNVDEDRERSDTEDESFYDGRTAVPREPTERRRPFSRSVPTLQLDGAGDDTPRQEQEGGWRDAAWLLSVASKVLL